MVEQPDSKVTAIEREVTEIASKLPAEKQSYLLNFARLLSLQHELAPDALMHVLGMSDERLQSYSLLLSDKDYLESPPSIKALHDSSPEDVAKYLRLRNQTWEGVQEVVSKFNKKAMSELRAILEENSRREKERLGLVHEPWIRRTP